MNPCGGDTLDQLRRLGWCHCRGCAEEEMNVIIDASNLKRRHAILFRNSPEIRPDAFFNLGLEPGFSLFRAEDDVVMK